MDELDLDTSMMPAADIDAHLRRLRQLSPSTDPAVLGTASDRAKAVTPSLVNLAHALADCIDSYRANGYSAGEIVLYIHDLMLGPLLEAPVINTDA